VLKAAGETETTQENIQDWLQLGEKGPGFQLLIEGEIAAVIFSIFLIGTTYIIKLSIYLVLIFYFFFFFCLLGLSSLH
jgi:hypothetical protein